MHPLKKRPDVLRPLPAFLSLETGAYEVNEPSVYAYRLGPRFDAAPVVIEPIVAPVVETTIKPVKQVEPERDWTQYDAPTWKRKGRPNPLRSTLALINLSAFLLRQAE